MRRRDAREQMRLWSEAATWRCVGPWRRDDRVRMSARGSLSHRAGRKHDDSWRCAAGYIIRAGGENMAVRMICVRAPWIVRVMCRWLGRGGRR